jgi:hypothetical protein
MTSKVSGGNYTATNYVYKDTMPNGRCIGRVNEFLVVGALSTNEKAIQWCAVGDPSDWPTPATDDARSKQSGLQALPSSLGFVTAIADGDFFGYVFQERGITKMTYVGGDVVFTFDTFEEVRGCVRAGRMRQADGRIFFESDRGYHMMDANSGQIVDIGYGRVDDTY